MQTIRKPLQPTSKMLGTECRRRRELRNKPSLNIAATWFILAFYPFACKARIRAAYGGCRPMPLASENLGIYLQIKFGFDFT